MKTKVIFMIFVVGFFNVFSSEKKTLKKLSLVITPYRSADEILIKITQEEGPSVAVDISKIFRRNEGLIVLGGLMGSQLPKESSCKRTEKDK